MSDELPADYPSEWETHAVLADGAPVELRPIRPSDRNRLDAFHRRQSPTSIYYRFFQHRPQLTGRELDYFTQIDYAERMAFVALIGDELVAVARYESMATGDHPEVAFLVDDEHHGRGLATLLLEYLAAAARAQGLTGFVATVLPENHGMLRVFRQAGFDVVTRFDDGLIEVELDISLTPETTEAIADRQSKARSASVARLLRPSSVAMVGASRRPGSLGHELFKQLLAGGFNGELFAVNPAADEILGQRVWPSLSAIETKVDLAVVAVPAAQVEAVVADAGQAQVSGLLVVSSGFGDRGPEGFERESQLVALALSHGMRLIGPNAFGMVNTASDIGLRALFLPVAPSPGSVAMVSQSGPLGSALLEHMTRSGVGVSSFVAVGNRADVSVNDLLEYWRLDTETEAILLYVENLGNPRNFARIAQAVSAVKPIVTLRPSSEHLSELLDQSGVITVDGVGELAAVAQLLVDQPVPAGSRVAIVTNAASVGRLTAAACTRSGLQVVTPTSVEQPFAQGAGGAVLVDDVDAISLAGGHRPPDYEEILVATAVSDEVDALLIAMVPNLELSYERLRDVIDRVNRSIQKPVLATGLVGSENIKVPGVPTFTFPEEAARTLGLVTAYRQWRRLQKAQHRTRTRTRTRIGNGTGTGTGNGTGSAPATDPHRQLTELLGDAEELVVTLWSTEARRVIDALGLPVPPWLIGSQLDKLIEGAERLGYPVVLKARDATNRSIGEAGGVAIDLHDASQLEAAFQRMTRSPGLDLLPAVVQKMVPAVGNAKIELIQDPALGAFVTVGPGGAAATRIPPTARRFLPLHPAATDDLITELADRLVLDDAAGRSIADLIDRLALLAQGTPELARVSLNPFLIAGATSAVGNLEVVIRPWRRDPLSEVRRL